MRRSSVSSVASSSVVSRHLPPRPAPEIAGRVVAHIARWLDCDPLHVTMSHRLEEDLDFTPLERVQVVLELERSEPCSVSLERVASSIFVSDLVLAVEDAVREAESARGWRANRARAFHQARSRKSQRQARAA